jgi:hypothetical protein
LADAYEARGRCHSVTIALGANPNSATLGGTLTRNAVNGVAGAEVSPTYSVDLVHSTLDLLVDGESGL